MAVNVRDYIAENYGLFINGEFVKGSSDETIEVTNPATGETLSHITRAKDKDVDHAVEVAQEAFESWSLTSKSERAQMLRDIGDKLMAQKDKIAMIETLNNGKPIRETTAIDIPFAARHFHYFASVIETEEGTVNDIDKDTMSIVRHEPIEGIQLGILFNQGEVCSAGSRLLVHEKIYDQLLPRLQEAFSNIKVGDPQDEATQMGSQTGKDQLDKIQSYIDAAKESDAQILAGGHRLTENGLDKGFFFEPTLIAVPDNHHKLAQEEIFGPVLTVIKVKDDQEAIDIANDSEYGLAGGVFSQNITRALNIAKAVRTGRIWINTYNQVPEGAPFGGYKKSGIGRETYKGALSNYQQVKNIYIDTSNALKGLY